MADEGKVQPTSCDREVFDRGTTVFRTDTIRSFNLEAWVQKIAARSGQRVDWYFAGGRAIVLALGDLEKVRAALRDMLAEHDAMHIEACRALGPRKVSPRQRRAAARCMSGAGRRSAVRVGVDGWSEHDAAHEERYLASMRQYAGLDGPGGIAPMGEEERAKFTVRIASPAGGTARA